MCTTNIVFSVDVTVVDMSGATVPDATLFFTVDGGSIQPCGGGLEEGTYACGADVSGHFVITAESRGLTGMAEADVSADACHVHPVTRTIKLGPWVR
jgi:hypothetical protein